MLNKEALELPHAVLKEVVDTNKSRLIQSVKNCKYFICDYFLNNTCYDITVSDGLGFRQVIPRKRDNSNDTTFKIVREYRICYSLESELRGFIDEIRQEDGVVLNSIKSYIQGTTFFKFEGFGDEYVPAMRSGFLITISFEIDRRQLEKNKSIEAVEFGLVLSRLPRNQAPVTKQYALKYNGIYNPFSQVFNKKFVVYRVFANFHKKIKNEYWFNMGEEPEKIENVCDLNKKEGVYITRYEKNLETDETEEELLKYIDFNEAANKNGVFTTHRDAMLASSKERNEKERDMQTSERKVIMEMLDFDKKAELNKIKFVTETIKAENEQRSFKNTIILKDVEHENSVELEKLKYRTIQADKETLKMKRDHAQVINNIEIENKKMNLEYNRLNHQMELDKAHVTHSNFVTQTRIKSAMISLEATSKASLLTLSAETDKVAGTRKKLEENTKLISGVAGLGSLIVKMVL